MRYYIIAGEASGDLHGSNLIKQLHLQDPQAEIRCWGGDKMQAAGATLVKHYKDLAFMGFVEVIKHLPTILKNISFCKEDIAAFKPDVIVMVDYPGFNMRIAQWAKQQAYKVVYYVSPQVWAWKENRVKKLKRDVDKMLVILPFEVDFYKKWNYDVTYVGHPLVEVVKAEQDMPLETLPNDKPIIAVLPGSRQQEILTKLPKMLTMVDRFPQYRFVVAQATAQPDSLYKDIIGNKDVLLIKGKTYDLLRQSRAAMVTSGTATLETALFAVPEVVCYMGNPLSVWLARKLIKIKYICLVNLIMDKEVVKELIQDQVNEHNLEAELSKLVADGPYRQQMLDNYSQLWSSLGAKKASATVAQEVILVAKGNS